MFCLSCGKELKEGTIFCTGCGRRIEEGDVAANPREYAQSTPPQTANPQIVNQQGQNYQSLNHQYGYSYSRQGYGQPVNGYGMTPYKIYKRNILPYKIVSAILNLISVVVISLIALMAVAFEEEEFSDYFKSGWVEGFQTYGFIAFLITLVLIIFVILGFALPAKAGVGINLITSITCMILAIWGIVLNVVLLTRVNEFISKIGYVYNDEVKPILGMTIAMGAVSLFLQIISLVFSCIGMTKKKIY